MTRIPMGEYSRVKVSQESNEKSEIIYSISINGKCIHTEINKDARQFENVLVYGSDPWYKMADATIRNYKLITPSPKEMDQEDSTNC